MCNLPRFIYSRLMLLGTFLPAIFLPLPHTLILALLLTTMLSGCGHGNRSPAVGASVTQAVSSTGGENLSSSVFTSVSVASSGMTSSSGGGAENRITASLDSLLFSSEVGANVPEIQSIQLINRGLLDNRFSIIDVPLWLSISPLTGNLSPDQSMVISIQAAACSQQVAVRAIVNIVPEFGDPLAIQVEQECLLGQQPTLDHFVLMDVQTLNPVPGYNPLTNGAVVDVSGRGIDKFTVFAVPKNNVGSVVFGLDEVERFQVESILPYALSGDNGSGTVLFPWQLGLGQHRVFARPYSEILAAGQVGQSISVDFSIVEFKFTASTTLLALNSVVGQAAPTPQKFTLSNDGNIEGQFNLINIPAWLIISPLSGTLSVGEKIDFSVESLPCTQLIRENGELIIATVDHDPVTINIQRYCGPELASIDFKLERFYFNQAVPAQDSAKSEQESIGVIAGRAGLARAFVTATNDQAPLPNVKLFWRDQNGAAGNYDLRGPSQALTTYDEGRLDHGFNIDLPAEFFSMGREYFIAVDPDNEIPEFDESNNRLPANEGDYLPLNPLALPVHLVTFIPIAIGNSIAHISSAQAEILYQETRALNPISHYELSVREQPFTYDIHDPNASWEDLLNQIRALQIIDNTGRHYHAITDVRVDNSLIGGIAYVGSKVAVSLRNPAIIAHEFGHNFSLNHAPCGIEGDEDYPYPGGITNSYGYNIFDHQITPPSATDFMGYCDNVWVSDWSFDRVINYRMAGFNNVGFKTSLNAPSLQSSLLINGFVANDTVHFGKILQLSIPSRFESEGDYQMVGLDAFGMELFRQAFYLDRIDHSEQQHFSVAVPLVESPHLLQKLQVIHSKRDAILGVKSASDFLSVRQKNSDQYPPEAISLGDDKVQIIWNPALYDAAMVRDLKTGNILAINSSGKITVISNSVEFELTFTKGFYQHKEIVIVQ
jgi:hypothetical protein